MNYKKILPVIALSALFLASCDDMIMEWGKDPSHGEITPAEVPLKLAEKITRYDILRNYTDFKLGVGVGVSLYNDDTIYSNIADQNFDEVTPGYEMKHGPMVDSKGVIHFEKFDPFRDAVRGAGLTIYGHTLVWHQNNNAAYLNGLIAPTVIPGSSGSNSLDLTGLKDGSFSGGWAKKNPGAGITVVDGAGMSNTTKAVKLISSATSANAWSLQLGTPNITIVTGHKYEVSFYIKSEQPGKGRISFSGLKNNYPWKDWYATGGSYTEAFETTSTWQQVKFPIAAADFADGGTSFSMNFDLGYLPNVTYYIDVNNIVVVDKDAPPTYVNMFSNGNFEGGTIAPWGGWGNSSTRAISASGEGYGSNYCMVMTNPTVANSYSAQTAYDFSAALTQGKEYTVSFMVKAASACQIQFLIQTTSDYSANYSANFDVTNTWTKVEAKITPTTATRTRFLFQFGNFANTYYIDDVIFTDGTADTGTPPTVVEKTDEEKKQIITASMTDWISKMVTHYKTDVFAWDVVNEPMLESGDVRTGNVSNLASDEFYWVKYMGKDYAVTAFNLARQYGNASDKLFINDYNLESNLTKCDGLINYVQYIEGKGATIDGIGTQMHISLTTDTVKMVQMFQKLAATGKLIKITELDVRMGTKDPTPEQLEAQAKMYRFVVDSYMKYIPEAQRYGVTAWAISDNEKEHEYWLPNESPCLWDANYQRKHAYKGFADGLAGYDVSEDFSGELEY